VVDFTKTTLMESDVAGILSVAPALHACVYAPQNTSRTQSDVLLLLICLWDRQPM